MAKEHDQKSYLAAFLLTAFLGLVGTNRLYTGHYLVGWIRCLLFVGSLVGPMFFLVNVTVGILATVLAVTAGTIVMVWWYIDLWLYYLGAVHDRASGEPLVVLGKKDKSYARSMMLSSHALVIIVPVLLTIGIMYSVSQVQNAFKQGTSIVHPTSTGGKDNTLNQLNQLQQLGL